ncbi:MAG: hypothetical protein V3U67_05620 [Gemmatimonadota bacterium]
MARRSFFAFVAIPLAILLLAAPASAQEIDAAFADALTRASEAGIPVSLLESKIAEGRAKGVPMDRIQEAVAQRTDALIKASATLQAAGIESPDAADLSVGADALQGGVSETVLATIAETSPAERRTVAIAALTQLVGAGIVADQALQQVEEALRRGLEALANLPLQAGAVAGTAPAAVRGQAGAASAAGGIPEGVPAAGRPTDPGNPTTP